MRPLAGGCEKALAEVYDAALLDLDGVVYVGPDPVPHAATTLATARQGGMRLAFVTNNAARTPQAVAEQLTGLGVPAQASEVATSAQAAARVLTELLPAGAAVLVVGGEGLEAALRDRGLRPVRSLDDDPAAVVQGFHPTVGWKQLAEGTFAVRRGLPWVASNTDLTIPTHRGLGPGNGTLVEVIRLATGARPIIAGKPELALHRESADRVGAQRPLVVGDRLDTDILGATRADTDCLLVLTGVTDPAQLLAARAELRPTYLAEDLRGLLVPHEPVQLDGETVRLGGWRAAVRDRRLELSGGGSRVDGLRAACVAAWAAGDDVDTADAASRLATAD